MVYFPKQVSVRPQSIPCYFHSSTFVSLLLHVSNIHRFKFSLFYSLSACWRFKYQGTGLSARHVTESQIIVTLFTCRGSNYLLWKQTKLINQLISIYIFVKWKRYIQENWNIYAYIIVLIFFFVLSIHQWNYEYFSVKYEIKWELLGKNFREHVSSWRAKGKIF